MEAEVGTLSILVEAGDEPHAPLWGDLHPAWRYPEVVEARVRAEALAGPVIKGFARHHCDYDADELLAVAHRLVPPEVATITQAGLGYIEICPPGVDKATGLAVVADALGVDPDDVLVFGDMPNDLPMFRWAGFGRVAVANAHPLLRAVGRRDHPVQRCRRGRHLSGCHAGVMRVGLVATDLDGTLVRND